MDVDNQLLETNEDNVEHVMKAATELCDPGKVFDGRIFLAKKRFEEETKLYRESLADCYANLFFALIKQAGITDWQDATVRTLYSSVCFSKPLNKTSNYSVSIEIPDGLAAYQIDNTLIRNKILVLFETSKQ